MNTQKSSFKLYTHQDSANGRKVLAVSYYLKLQPDIIKINIYQGEGQNPEYLKINPFGKIPTLVDEEISLWESNAIIQYIADKYGYFKLSSNDIKKRADISRWLFWESAHWQPAISVILASAVGHRLLPKILPPPNEPINWRHAEFNKQVRYLDSHLAKNSFLVNNELTIADFAVAGMMTYFHFAEFSFDQFPNISKWYENIESLDAWKKSESTLWAKQ